MSVPQLAHIGSSVNNDNLVVLFGALITLGAAAVSTGDLGRRRAPHARAAHGAGAAHQGHRARARADDRARVRGPLARRAAARAPGVSVQSGAVALVVSGWWYVRNLIEFGTLQPSDTFWLVPRHVDPVVGDWAERFFYLLAGALLGPLRLPRGEAEPAAGGARHRRPCWRAWGGRSCSADAAWLGGRPPRPVRQLRGARRSQVVDPLPPRGPARSPASRGATSSSAIVGMMVAVGSAVDGLPSWFAAARGARLGVLLLVAIHAAAVARIVRGFWGTESEPWSDRLDDLRAFRPSPTS